MKFSRRAFFATLLAPALAPLSKIGCQPRRTVDLSELNAYVRSMAPQITDVVFAQSPLFARLNGIQGDADYAATMPYGGISREGFYGA